MLGQVAPVDSPIPLQSEIYEFQPAVLPPSVSRPGWRFLCALVRFIHAEMLAYI